MVQINREAMPESGTAPAISSQIHCTCKAMAERGQRARRDRTRIVPEPDSPKGNVSNPNSPAIRLPKIKETDGS